jgi:hypothetical protein
MNFTVRMPNITNDLVVFLRGPKSMPKEIVLIFFVWNKMHTLY